MCHFTVMTTYSMKQVRLVIDMYCKNHIPNHFFVTFVFTVTLLSFSAETGI